MSFNHNDPFDLDDHRPRKATNRDRLIAAGVREAERQREADPDPRPTIERRILNGTLRPDWTTHAEVFQWQAREDARRANLERLHSSPSALSRAWEAAGGKDQVVS